MDEEIFAALVTNIVRIGQMFGLPEPQLWAAAGVDPSVAHDPDRRVKFRALVTIWDYLMAQFPGMPIGMRIGQMMDYGNMGLAWQLTLTSPDLRTAIDRKRRLTAVMDPTLSFELEEAGDLAHVRMRHSVPEVRAQVEPMEMLMAMVSLDVRKRIPSAPEDLVAVHFAHPRRHPMQEYDTMYLGAPVLFEQPDYGFTVKARLLDEPFPDANVEAGRYIEAFARTLGPMERTSTSETTEARLRGHLHDAMARADDLSQNTVARGLGLSTRSLQRRLSGEGTSFAAVLGDVRRIHALRLLEDRSLAVYEVAFLLGYSEATSFYRAFKRWTGQTPEAFRSAA